MQCGTIDKNDQGLCINDHDAWLEPVDVMNADPSKIIGFDDQPDTGGTVDDCTEWVNTCIRNTGMDIDQIWEKMKGGICI